MSHADSRFSVEIRSQFAISRESGQSGCSVSVMDFSIPQEYLDFREAVYRFSKDKLAPRSQDLDARGEFSWENWHEMAAMGLLGLPFPERYGGSEATPLATCLAMEAMGAAGVDAGTPLAWGAHTILCGVPIWLLGTEYQRQ